MQHATIPSLFRASAEQNRVKIAFHYFDKNWKSLTYEEFYSQVKGIITLLVHSGAKPGDRVAIVAENRFEWCAAYLAIVTAGNIAVPMDAQLGQNEIMNILGDSGAVLVFCSSRTEQHLRGFKPVLNFDAPEFRSAQEGQLPGHFPEIAADDLASLVYTSGTTGTPKGVMLSHRNFCSDAEAVIRAEVVTHDDNVLSILPLHHTYPFLCTFLVPLFLGATITYPVGIKGAEILSAIREKGVTILVAVPQLLDLMRNTFLTKMKELPRGVSYLMELLYRGSGLLRRRFGLNAGRIVFRPMHRAFGRQFRFFASGGARLDPQVMSGLEAFGFVVVEGYGLTETSPVVTFNPVGRRKPGSAGRPLPTAEIKIMNPSETGEGEIAVKGPMVMKGYYKRPEETALVMNEGFFLTGDIGYLDREGYLFITGRTKEVIVLSSGKNVYPEDVEKEYLTIPLVREICVVGIEDDGGAGHLHGLIVPDVEFARKERIGNIQETLKWEISKVSMKMPPFMRLKGFSVQPDSLPRTRLGKLKRFAIKEIISRKGAEAGKTREEDRGLTEDPLGKKVVECIRGLMAEDTPVRSSDSIELDLGFDSLRRIELVASLEKAFSLKLPETFGSEIFTVGELVTRIREMGTGPGPAVGQQQTGAVFSQEPTDEEIRKIGLGQGRVEQALSAVFLVILKIILKFFFRLDVRGRENLPESPFIIAPNHCSNMDGFVVGAAVPPMVFRKLYFLGFQIYFQGLLPALFARLAHVIPIDQETYLSRALTLSSYVLGKGQALCVFPEGGRSFDGDLMEFKKGIGILALDHGIPVVPARIDGTFRALPRGARWPRAAKVTITFGRLFSSSDLDLAKKPAAADKYQFFADQLRERVRALGGSISPSE